MEGRKRTESWDDKQTGAKHYRDLVYVDRIEFLDSKGHARTAIGIPPKAPPTRQQRQTKKCRFDAILNPASTSSFSRIVGITYDLACLRQPHLRVRRLPCDLLTRDPSAIRPSL